MPCLAEALISFRESGKCWIKNENKCWSNLKYFCCMSLFCITFPNWKVVIFVILCFCTCIPLHSIMGGLAVVSFLNTHACSHTYTFTHCLYLLLLPLSLHLLERQKLADIDATFISIILSMFLFPCITAYTPLIMMGGLSTVSIFYLRRLIVFDQCITCYDVLTQTQHDIDSTTQHVCKK